MIISHKRRFVLFSPWKTASSTCHRRLETYNESPYNRFFYFNPVLKRVTHQHVTVADFKCLPESSLGYYKAAFVRNPYDRAYSGFLQLQRDVINQPGAGYEDDWVRQLVKLQLAENFKRIIEAEHDFNRWIMLLPDYEICDIGRNTNMSLHPAHYWTHDGDGQYVDFIGKVEDFEADFTKFCEAVGITSQDTSSDNVSEELPLGGDGYKYAATMTSDAIRRINDVFRRDFELFDYAML